MPISIKTSEEIDKMRVAGRLAASTLEMIQEYVQPGITTDKLNQICHDYILANDAYPAPLNYHGFPKSICTSVNHVVCHGIPSDKKLKKGDILNIDVTVIKDEYHGDTSKTFFVGGENEASTLAKRLVRITQEAMIVGIKMVRPGLPLNDIGKAIQQHVEDHHFTVVREYCGHGIGSIFHEPELQVLHYDDPKVNIILEEGMTFTIEPMVNAGKRDIKLLGDQWTVVTKDRMLSAQWEHTLAVTQNGYEVLTRRTEELW